MRAGRVVETGVTGELFALPRHAYTRELLDAIPGARPRGRPGRHHHDMRSTR